MRRLEEEFSKSEDLDCYDYASGSEMEYGMVRIGLIGMFQSMTEEEYDWIFYMIGQYDFDPTDIKMVIDALDLLLAKTTEDMEKPYRDIPTNVLESRLYRYERGTTPHPTVEKNVRRREAAERAAGSRGMFYVPECENFMNNIGIVRQAMTGAEMENFREEEAHGAKVDPENQKAKRDIILFAVGIIAFIVFLMCNI